jgi:hypothetical protein
MLKQIQRRVKTLKIPFNEIPIGKSVIIPIDAIKETYLRNVVCQTNKRLEPKHFACVKHKQHGIFEVGRIADIVVTEVVETVILQQFDSSPQLKGNE